MGAPAAERVRRPCICSTAASTRWRARLDKEKVRAGLRRTAQRTLADLKDFRVPTLLIAGGRRRSIPALPGSAVAAKPALRRSRSDSRGRPLAIFRAAPLRSTGWSRRFSRASAEELRCFSWIAFRACVSDTCRRRWNRWSSSTKYLGGPKLWIKRDDCTGLSPAAATRPASWSSWWATRLRQGLPTR